MYLRPGSLFRWFTVESAVVTVNDMGRTVTTFEDTGKTIFGVLADAKTSEKLRWQQLQHPITHTIVQRNGEAMAKPGDRLLIDGRIFLVQGVDNVSTLGLFTLYYIEERSDFLE